MKRKLTILGIVILTLLMPFVINILNLIIIFSLEDSLEITNDSIPFIIHLIGLILLFICLWIIFIKTKERYLADIYIAFICLIAVFIGLFFFAVWTQVYPHLSSYDRMINSP
ncbi:hypothetical protein [Helicobacter cinaedi]|uniref:hypothetical protein n=1 Tax=Helicobacter cinaedi TaxID=213 RepID=UPI000CF1AA12|nr:hypothetical protein [Helicobacter cinaedi]BBB20394.1 hypothetical protein HC081234_15710 [Helicobacter cinaedi]